MQGLSSTSRLSLSRSMWRYRATFPIGEDAHPVTLGEGGTPLLNSRLFQKFSLFWKDESRNPTGSHKDRALSLAATHAHAMRARVMVVVSAGSTGLSNAAYAARAGIPSVTLMGRGAPIERVYPAHALGSRLIELDCGIDDAIEALRKLSGRDGIYVASTTRSSNPIQAEAPKTIAYEIVDDLGSSPDWVVVPTGGGGTIAGVWQGFQDLYAAGTINSLPRLAAVVPKSYDGLRRALAEDIGSAEDFAAMPYFDDAPTVLTKLSHAHPPDGLAALVALRASEGVVLAFTDAEAIAAVPRIGARDGLYLEPSSAIALPAIEELARRGLVESRGKVVALACGSGFRETFVLQDAQPIGVSRADLGQLHTAIISASTR
jgi:threonine synthase